MELKGKKVLVFGAGVSGVSAAQVLHDQGALATLADGKDQQHAKAAASLAALAGKVELGDATLVTLSGGNVDPGHYAEILAE